MLDVLPSDPTFWIVLVCLVAAVIAAVVWLGTRRPGRQAKVKWSRGGIEVEAGGGEEVPDRVAGKAKLSNARVGNIVGHRIRGEPGAATGRPVEVAAELQAEGSEIADIVGLDIDGRDRSPTEV